ncbi:YodC family protein [Rhizobium johnstonii]|uniref:YodC family protein n=1 Tax=Rhizobium johnstonii TaxID=3019933 RepID=UPI000B34A578|nr:DUF2158 domain-containing protein [Rhizobium johnstonii]
MSGNVGEFQVGDRVILKSGGPDMTVNSFKDSGAVICVWFNGSGNNWEAKFESFLPKTLRKLA